MTTSVFEIFPPLQGAISQAESWAHYLNDRPPDMGDRRPEEIGAALEDTVWLGVKLGEILPFTWRLTFDKLFRPGQESWSTVQELEAIRQAVRCLFFETQEAMDKMRRMAEVLQPLIGRKPEGMDRLLAVIEEARQLEAAVFRDWPSFTDARPRVNYAKSLPVDQSLAQALGITVEEAQHKMDARRRELNAKQG